MRHGTVNISCISSRSRQALTGGAITVPYLDVRLALNMAAGKRALSTYLSSRTSLTRRASSRRPSTLRGRVSRLGSRRARKCFRGLTQVRVERATTRPSAVISSPVTCVVGQGGVWVGSSGVSVVRGRVWCR